MDLRTGRVLPTFRKEIYKELIDSIASNTSHYYAFAAVSDKTSTNVEIIDDTDYINQFTPTWKMVFGKKLYANNVMCIVKKNTWAPNTVYTKYDNTDANLHSESNFYVFSPPAIDGGFYHIYKCIDNANGAPSTVKPIIVQKRTFQTADKYKWKYLTSVSYKDFQNYSTTNYAPIYSNSSITAESADNSGVEVVIVTNGGSYNTYHNANVKSVANNTVVQISDEASSENGYYVNGSIYIYRDDAAVSELLDIVGYEANGSGKWIRVSNTNPISNTLNIIPGSSRYIIAPKIVFDTDGTSDPIGYAVMNTFSNSIHSVVVLDPGKNITWANVSVQSNSLNTNTNNKAVLYAIVPPPGGHGSDPESELDVKGVTIHFSFANTENDTIPTDNIVYDTVGLIKNPYAANDANTNILRTKSQTRYWANTFSQITSGNVNVTFNVGEKVKGNTSGAIGEVLFSNGSYVYLIGDKYFIQDEYIVSMTENGNSAQFFIDANSKIANGQPQVYTKDLTPLYVQYINTIDRSIANNQTETFNLLLQF